TVIGVPDDALNRASSVEELREIVDDAGGVMISAHPFRYFPGPWSLLFPWIRAWGAHSEEIVFEIQELAQHPVFALADAVETLNMGSTMDQNRWAFEVARLLGLPTVGGSDAHGKRFLGRHATRFFDTIEDEASLIAAIRAGRCEAVWRRSDEYHPAETLFRLD
ncbi:MAG: PHP-associated domain-containing protein, partial [Tepidiformaceae bacterium]